jgi:transcriptional regulator with XRE-family HTH domain
MGDSAYKKFRELLLAARKSSKPTQSELGIRSKRPQSFASKYERGERHLAVAEFGKVSRVLKTGPIALLGKFYGEIL